VPADRNSLGKRCSAEFHPVPRGQLAPLRRRVHNSRMFIPEKPESVGALITEIADLEADRCAAQAQLKGEVVVWVKQQMKQYGISASELREVNHPSFGVKLPVKHVGPNGETWSGRGKTPLWFKGTK